MKRIDGGTRSGFNFPDTPFLCLERNGESEELSCFWSSVSAKHIRRYSCGRVKGFLPYSTQHCDLRESVHFIWISALHEIGLMEPAMIAGV